MHSILFIATLFLTPFIAIYLNCTTLLKLATVTYLSSHLIFGEHLLSSNGGVQQGDQMGHLLFSLATFSSAKSMESGLDNGCLGGDVDLLISDFECFKNLVERFDCLLMKAIVS
jgi:hypothetical protein